MLHAVIKYPHDEPKTVDIDESQQKFLEDGQNVLGYDIISLNNNEGQPVLVRESYRGWRHHVSRLILDISGISTSDIPDFDYHSSYDCGMSCWDTAVEALREADFPFPDGFDPEELGEKDGLLFLATFGEQRPPRDRFRSEAKAVPHGWSHIEGDIDMDAQDRRAADEERNELRRREQ